MLRERANGYTKKIVRLFLVESGLWEWAQVNAANDDPPGKKIVNPIAAEMDTGAEDWRAEFEEALKELEEEEEEEEIVPEAQAAPPPTPAPTPSATFKELNLENVQSVFDELVRPALQADGGDITLVKIEDNNIHVELIGACSTCPSATMTMKMGIEQMLHDEFPELGELVNVAGEPQPFF